jgi:cytochrome d ubiquinol oxidase subunit II
MDLNLIWFLLVGVLVAGYAVLDGFDLGIGALSLFARSDEERDVHVAAVAPVWDGNEVWLLTGGGALFAAFPLVYATVFSGFYLALMLVLVALIARAVSLEFRHQYPGAGWRRFWDVAFGVGSLLPAILFGVAVGNVLHGVPIDAAHEWRGSFLGLLNPYSILVGLVSTAMFVMQGALYLRMKAGGALEARMARVAVGAWAAFVALFLAATAWSFVGSPFLFGRLGSPLVIALLVVLLAALVAVPVLTRGGKPGRAFLASSVVIVTGILVVAANAFPVLVPSSLGLEHSLTVYNASSSPRTLLTMLVVALAGMPVVIGYTIFSYRVFRGKARPADAYGAADPKAA